MKTIIAQGREERVAVKVEDNLTNAEAARKAAEALGATGGHYLWEGQPFAYPKVGC